MRRCAWCAPGRPAVIRLPADVRLDAILAARCNNRLAGPTIRFFASGMSCGGTIALTRLGVGYQVRVNWLTGGVGVVPFEQQLASAVLPPPLAGRSARSAGRGFAARACGICPSPPSPRKRGGSAPPLRLGFRVKRVRSAAGFTLIEVLVALTVVAVTLSAIGLLVAVTIRGARSVGFTAPTPTRGIRPGCPTATI